MTFKLTRNDIIALELRKNMDIDNALRLDFGPELILLCTRKFEKKNYEIVSKDCKTPLDTANLEHALPICKPNQDAVTFLRSRTILQRNFFACR